MLFRHFRRPRRRCVQVKVFVAVPQFALGGRAPDSTLVVAVAAKPRCTCEIRPQSGGSRRRTAGSHSTARRRACRRSSKIAGNSGSTRSSDASKNRITVASKEFTKAPGNARSCPNETVLRLSEPSSGRSMLEKRRQCSPGTPAPSRGSRRIRSRVESNRAAAAISKKAAKFPTAA